MSDNETAVGAMTTFRNVALCAAVICAATVLFYARGAWAIVLLGLLTYGVIALLWLAGAVGIGGAALRAARVRFDSISVEVCTAAALGLGVESILVLLLGLAGALNRVTAVAIVLVGVALFCWWIVPLSKRHARVEVTTWLWLWLLAMPGLAIALVCAFVPPGILWGGDEPNGYDVVEYHFQVPREWYELGRIVPLTHNVFSYFPFNVEMHYLLAMHLRGGPWAGMYLAQLVHVAFVALSVVAVHGILTEMRSRHASLGAIAAASAPWLILLAPIGYNEGGLLLFGTLAIGLMMIAMRSPTPLRVAALAGAMAGFACGTKPTAVPTVLLAAPVAMTIVAVVWHGRLAHAQSRSEGSREATPTRRVLGTAAVFVLVGTLVYSPWLGRNLLWTGNPFFPEAMSVLGRAHFSEDQVERWRRAHSPREDQRSVIARLKELNGQVLTDWRFAFALLPLAVIAFALNWRRRDVAYLFVILVLLTVIWLAFTHLQSRFYILAVPLAALLIGLMSHARVAAAFAVAVGLSTVVGLYNVNAKLRSRPVFLLLGLDRVTSMTPLADVTISPDEHVALVGEAKAFWYEVPTSRLYYRTVFDVNARDGQSSVDAWMNGVPDAHGKTVVLIDPSELIRFDRTYWKIPPPPADVAQSDRPIIQRR